MNFINWHFITLTQISGTAMSAAKRFMFSYEMVPISEISQLKDIQEMLLPIMWVEEGVILDKKYVNIIKYQLYL